MTFQGLDPGRARTLSAEMRKTGLATDGLSGEVTAVLTLSQLDSTIPGQLVSVGGELDQVGIIVEARVDVVEGFVIDPATLAGDLGITVAQAEAAVAVLAEPDVDQAELTPILDALIETKTQAEILRQSFQGLPPSGTDADVDSLLLRLATWLPAALESGEKPSTLTDEQLRDLSMLAVGLDLDQLIVHAGSHVTGIPIVDFESDSPFFQLSSNSATEQVLRGDGPTNGDNIGAITDPATAGVVLFEQIAKAHELDSRIRAAAGLPTINDIYVAYAHGVRNGDPNKLSKTVDAANVWLPAYLAGEGEIPDDRQLAGLAISLAGRTGWQGGEGWGPNWQTLPPDEFAKQLDSALAHLKGNRLLQKALIPGDFEGATGPVIVWTEGGIETALLAGERSGVLNDQTRSAADDVAANVLLDPSGGDGPIELTDEHTKALVTSIVIQSGKEFVVDNPGVQRQLVSAINLVGQQATLADQRRVFARAIEAFRSLAVVGSPSVTFAQLKAAVGPQVTNELGYRELTARTAEAVAERPQFATLINHWGIPGEDTLKLPKYKFSFRFDEQGRLTRVRNKKLSKWKRFKNTISAIGDGIEQAFEDDPLKAIFEVVKIAASVVLTVFPGTQAAGAALILMAVDTALQLMEGDYLGAAGSAFGAIGGAASVFGDVAVAGSTAANVAKVATTAESAISAIDTGLDVVDELKDGDILGAAGDFTGVDVDAFRDGDILGGLASSFSVLGDVAAQFPGADALGSTANLVSNAAKFGDKVVTSIDTGFDLVGAIEDGDVLGALGSGFAFGSSLAPALTSGADLANGANISAGGTEALESFRGNPLVDQQLLQHEIDHSLISSETIDTIDRLGETAGDFVGVTKALDGTVTAVQNGDGLGAIANGFSFLGETSKAVSNKKGFVRDAVGIDHTTGEVLDHFSQRTSVQLATGADVVGSVIAGDEIGALEGVVDFAQIGVEPDSRLEGQLNVVDEGLDVARLIEGVHNGAPVPELGTLAREIIEVGANAFAVPAAPKPIIDSDGDFIPEDLDFAPNNAEVGTIVDAAESRLLEAEDQVIGRDGGGNLLIDRTGDGIADARLTRAGVGSDQADPANGPPRPSLPDQALTPKQEQAQLELSDLRKEAGFLDDKIAKLGQQIQQRYADPSGQPPNEDLAELRRLIARRDRVGGRAVDLQKERRADQQFQAVAGGGDLDLTEEGFGADPGLSIGAGFAAQFLGQSAHGEAATGSFVDGFLSKEIGGDGTSEISGGSLTKGKVNDFVSVELKDGEKTRVTAGDDSVRTEQIDFTEVKARLGGDEPLGESVDASGKPKKSDGRRVEFGLERTASHGDVTISEQTVDADGTVLRGQGTGSEASLGLKATGGLSADTEFLGQEFTAGGQVGAGISYDTKSSQVVSKFDGDPDTVVVVNEDSETVSLGLEGEFSGAARPVDGALGNASSAKVVGNLSVPIDETKARSTVRLTSGQVDNVVLQESRSGPLDNSGSRTEAELEAGRTTSLLKIDQSNGLLSDQRETLQAEFGPDGTVTSGTRVQDEDGLFADTTGLVEFERDADGNIEQSLEIEVDDGFFSDSTIETVTERLPDGSVKKTETKITENLFSDPTVERTETIMPNRDLGG